MKVAIFLILDFDSLSMTAKGIYVVLITCLSGHLTIFL